jgi:hypothetical protein
MKLHRDVVAIKRAAPKWANWLCFCWDRCADWQTHRGTGRVWVPDEVSSVEFAVENLPHDFGVFAIDLQTGDVHLQDAEERVTVVPQATWVAARKRKAKP